MFDGLRLNKLLTIKLIVESYNLFGVFFAFDFKGRQRQIQTVKRTTLFLTMKTLKQS